MAAPASNGKLCFDIKDMQIGDYIACLYTGHPKFIANLASWTTPDEAAKIVYLNEFTAIGVDPTQYKELPAYGPMQRNAARNAYVPAAGTYDRATDYGRYLHYNFSPLSGPTHNALNILESTMQTGIFYFIKVDTGLLVADRMFKSLGMCGETLNTQGYINGKVSLGGKGLMRTLTRNEFRNYLMASDLNGTIIKCDPQVWHAWGYDQSRVSNAGWILNVNDNNGSGWCSILFDILQDRHNDKIGLAPLITMLETNYNRIVIRYVSTGNETNDALLYCDGDALPAVNVSGHKMRVDGDNFSNGSCYVGNNNTGHSLLAYVDMRFTGAQDYAGGATIVPDGETSAQCRLAPGWRPVFEYVDNPRSTNLWY